MIQKATLDFLKKLDKNNNKAWFDEHRKKYQEAKEDFENFIDELLNGIRKFDHSIEKELTGKKCMFRIFRDVRFSKDKTPYKTHFGAFMGPGGRKSTLPGYYIHLKPGEIFTGGGMYMPQSKDLAAIRQEIDYNAQALKKVLKSAAFKKYFDGLHDHRVKTSPKGYSKDHPEIELIRYKSFFCMSDLNQKDLVAKDASKEVLKRLKASYKLNQFLSEAIA